MHWTEKFPCLWRPILLLITFTAASLSPPPLMYLTIKWGKKVTNTFLQSDFQVRVSPNQLSDPGLLDPCLLYQIIISRIFVFRLIVFRPWTTFEMFWYCILVNKYFFCICRLYFCILFCMICDLGFVYFSSVHQLQLPWGYWHRGGIRILHQEILIKLPEYRKFPQLKTSKRLKKKSEECGESFWIKT